MAAALAERPDGEPWPVSVRHVLCGTVRRAMAEQPEVTLVRARLLAEVPAVRSRTRESLSATGRLLADAIAARTGLDPDGLEVRVATTSLLGGLLEATAYWAEHGHTDDLAALVDRALDVVEHGLPTAKSRSGGHRT
jgi:hypothetical protein